MTKLKLLRWLYKYRLIPRHWSARCPACLRKVYHHKGFYVCIKMGCEREPITAYPSPKIVITHDEVIWLSHD